MTVAGTETGFFLWDADRGLVARAEVSRSYEGSAEVPGQGSISMKHAATRSNPTKRSVSGGRSAPAFDVIDFAVDCRVLRSGTGT